MKSAGTRPTNSSKPVELHQTLVKSFDAFDAANKQLSAHIDTLQDEEDARDLVRIEKTEGRKLPFLVRASYVSAKATTRIAGEAAKAKDLALFSKAYTDIDTIVKELLAYRDAHGGEAHKAGVQGFTQEAEKPRALPASSSKSSKTSSPLRPNRSTINTTRSCARSTRYAFESTARCRARGYGRALSSSVMRRP